MTAYSVLLGLGAALGLGWSAWQCPSRRRRALLDAGLLVLFGALLGGRLVYLLWHWEFYRQELQEAFLFSAGGLDGPGALAGGLTALVLAALWQRLPLGWLADHLVPVFALTACAAWLGCWPEGCAYGAQLPVEWGPFAPDESGMLTPRFPVQALGALLSLLVWWAAGRLSQPAGKLLIEQMHPLEGRAASLSLALFGAGWLLLSWLRADPAPILAGQRWETWAALVLMLPGLVLLVLPWLRAARSDPSGAPAEPSEGANPHPIIDSNHPRP